MEMFILFMGFLSYDKRSLFIWVGVSSWGMKTTTTPVPSLLPFPFATHFTRLTLSSAYTLLVVHLRFGSFAVRACVCAAVPTVRQLDIIFACGKFCAVYAILVTAQHAAQHKLVNFHSVEAAILQCAKIKTTQTITPMTVTSPRNSEMQRRRKKKKRNQAK